MSRPSTIVPYEIRLLATFVVFALVPSVAGDESMLIVSSPEDSFINAIEGFGTDLQCFVNSCVPRGRSVKWYKDNKLIADGVKVVSDDTKRLIRHNVQLDHTKDCSGRCSAVDACGAGMHCLDNSCCQCSEEEFTLVIYNLSLADSGIYQCRLDQGNYVEFEVQVLEGGSFPTFAQNLTFDYSECCQQNGMSTECRPMCKPGALETHKFDPIPCQKEFGKLLSCATHGGNTSHAHCCRLHFVPPFCWDYCSGTNTQFEKANRLCVYWMPEIFQCYEQAYLPIPGYPERLVVDSINSTAISACWQPPRQRPETVKYYSVRYQEMPRFPFFSGSVPFLTGDENQSGFEEMGAPPVEPDQAAGSSIIRRPNLSPPDGHENRDRKPAGRKKRQTLVITTHNFATNETEVREYRYKEFNTTDTCATIDELKPATQYTLYVTANNDYGSGLPSVKASTSTSDVPLSNVSLPNIKECCVKHQVEPDCVTKMCDVSQPPTAVGAFDIALTCRTEFPQVAPCLADGRDHTDCCRGKGVGGECLKLCDGTASALAVNSVLCLSLDMNSIYSCLRQGYETHPSPPTNVTVIRITGTTAVVKWSPPKDNGEKVNRYSLFYLARTDDGYIEIQNVTSPYEMDDLQPDTSYSVYLVAYTPEGKSLKSAVIQFTTGEHPVDSECEFGQPLRDSYGFPVVCGPRVACPVLFECVNSGTDDDDARYCCPTKTVVNPEGQIPEPNISSCCAAKGVKGKCLDLCSYSTSADDLIKNGRDCISHVKTWLDCGGDGRDDRPCCVRQHVPEPCTEFCYPTNVETMRIRAEHIPCVQFVRDIAKCALDGIYNLPGSPRHLRIFGQGTSWVALLWDKPLQAVQVDAYEVWLADEASRVLTFNTSAVSLTIPDLKPDVRYNAHVRSLNSKGASVPTENLTFTLKEGMETEIPSVEQGPSADSPTAPVNLTVMWYRNRKANLTWAWTRDSLSNKSIDRYEFNVSYGESLPDKDRIQWTSVTTKDYDIVLNDLKVGAAYDAYVSATDLDNKSQGLPSSVVTFRTTLARAAPTAEIQSFPSGDLSVGEKVSISCTAHGDPQPNVTLSTSDKQLASGAGSVSKVIEHVTLDDSNEFFECIADNGDFVPFRTTLWLKVKYQPKITSNADTITVVEDLRAVISCHVRGVPTPDVSWYYQTEEAKRRDQKPQQLSPDEKHLIETKGDQKDNSFNATMTIYRAGKDAAGLYYCKACNDLGCTNATTRLLIDSWPVPTGPDYLHECCKEKRVLDECMSACTSDIDMHMYENNLRCIDEFPKLMACTKDGFDQSSCCRTKGVPSECLWYCNRGLRNDAGAMANIDRCQKYTSPMIACAEEAHKMVPGMPRNVRVHALDAHVVNVTWDPPAKESESIPMYVVYYKGTMDKNYTTVRTEKSWARISNLDTSAEYNITVIAANNYGFSVFTPLVSKTKWSTDMTTSTVSEGSHSTAGTVLGVIFCILFAAVLVLAAIYLSRRPYRLPTFLLKLTQRRRRQQESNGSAAVAFENPGYDKEGQIRGLPGDKLTSPDGIDEVNGSASNGNSSGWEQPHLETPQDSPAVHRSGKYVQLT